MRVDAHVHIVSAPQDYPFTLTRAYLPQPAPLARLRQVSAPLGVDRFVLVQPSFYGTDNSLLLQSLRELDGAGRGVAVVDAQCTHAQLKILGEGGVRALRVNLYSRAHGGEAADFADSFHAMADMAGAMGWHVQIIASLKQVLACGEWLASAGVPIVLDHYGLPAGASPQSAEGQVFLQLVQSPHIWVKLSAPYRHRDSETELEPDAAWLRALLAAAPARCVWGSDWPFTPDARLHHGPHEAAPYRPIDFGDMFDAFGAAVVSADALEAVLTHNPAKLYGFVA